MFKNKEYILGVYREGGFSRAAEKLFVSQPSLSATVRRVEERVGAPIFDRSNNPVGLTDVGREYVRIAAEIEAREADFERYLSDREGLMAGSIRIGGTSFFSAFVLPKMISRFREKYSGIAFEISEDSTKNLMARLAGGELDVVVDNVLLEDEDVICDPYITERLMLAVPVAMAKESLSELALTAEDVRERRHLERGWVDIRELCEQPFILLNSENDTGRRAEALFAECGISPRVIFRLDQQVTAYNVARSGMGICFVSDTLVRRMGAAGSVVYYNLSPHVAERTIYVYRKRKHYHSLAARRFVELSVGKG